MWSSSGRRIRGALGGLISPGGGCVAPAGPPACKDGGYGVLRNVERSQGADVTAVDLSHLCSVPPPVMLEGRVEVKLHDPVGERRSLRCAAPVRYRNVGAIAAYMVAVCLVSFVSVALIANPTLATGPASSPAS